MRHPLVIAHRGASGLAPENTSAAVATAIELGADMVEVDVQLSRDGQPVIFHDFTVARTVVRPAGSPALKKTTRLTDLTLEEIRSLDVGSWFDRAFAGQRVPILAEVLAQCAGRIELNLEIKLDLRAQTEGAARRETVVAELERALREYSAEGHVLISSSDHTSLELVRRRMPGVRLGVLPDQGDIPGALRVAGRLHAWSLHLAYAKVRPPLLASAHRLGLRVYPYTVNRIAAMRRLIAGGVDGIFTDYPDRLIRTLKGKAAS
jgi:glycerophosphoryl diester phosphodiesterase